MCVKVRVTTNTFLFVLTHSGLFYFDLKSSRWSIRIYRVCRKFRLTKRVDYFWVNFDHFWIKQYFWISGSVMKIDSSLKPNHLGKFSLPKSVKRSVRSVIIICVPGYWPCPTWLWLIDIRHKTNNVINEVAKKIVARL